MPDIEKMEGLKPTPDEIEAAKAAIKKHLDSVTPESSQVTDEEMTNAVAETAGRSNPGKIIEAVNTPDDECIEDALAEEGESGRREAA